MSIHLNLLTWHTHKTLTTAEQSSLFPEINKLRVTANERSRYTTELINFSPTRLQSAAKMITALANGKLIGEPIGKLNAIWNVTDAHIVFCSLGNYKTNYTCFDLIQGEISRMVTYSNPQ